MLRLRDPIFVDKRTIMASNRKSEQQPLEVETCRRKSAKGNSTASIESWSQVLATAAIASLFFSLTGCGDSNASGIENVTAIQIERSTTASSGAESAAGVQTEKSTAASSTVSLPGSLPPEAEMGAFTPLPPQANSSVVSTTPPSVSEVNLSGLRILPLGDSMTAGNESDPSAFRSYRGPLYRMLRSAGQHVDLVGTMSEPPSLGGDPDHSGYGGAQIGPGGSSNNLWDRVPDILNSVGNPDVIILALGWNSTYQEPEYAAAKYEGLVRLISSLRPNATLILATLSPQRGETESQTNAQLSGYRKLNAKARELANSSQADKILLADLAIAGFKAADYWDVIHWVQSGADKAATVMVDVLTANGSLITAR